MKHHRNFISTPGRLFVFEGPDDVGKSTLAGMLHQHLLQHHEAALFSFPGNEPGTLGQLVYRFYHNPLEFGIPNVSSVAMQLMVTAAHVEVIETRVKPLIRSGADVVLDRFWWSTWVYASMEGVPDLLTERLIEFELEVWENITPTKVFLVVRQEPFLQKRPTRQWREVLSRYERLVELEKTNKPIGVIRNEGTPQEALQTVLSTLE